MYAFENLLGFIGSIFMALILICAGLPLLNGLIKKNPFYGYYLSKDGLNHDTVWYPVNRKGGLHLVVIGSFLALNALVALYFFRNLEAQLMIIRINLYLVGIGLIYSVIRTASYSQKLSLMTHKTKKRQT
jgi:hypothetical protein